MEGELYIRSFEVGDQEQARWLILEGLGEHFGYIDETLNPDLDDILHTYIIPGHVFMIACIGREMVGIGALILHGEGISEMVRISTRKEYRRRGIGRAIITYLVNIARLRPQSSIPGRYWCAVILLEISVVIGSFLLFALMKSSRKVENGEQLKCVKAVRFLRHTDVFGIMTRVKNMSRSQFCADPPNQVTAPFSQRSLDRSAPGNLRQPACRLGWRPLPEAGALPSNPLASLLPMLFQTLPASKRSQQKALVRSAWS